jgi:hypothetical protein
VSRAAANADETVADVQYLVVRGILRGVQASVAEGGQGICGDGGDTVLSDSDDGSHLNIPYWPDHDFII